MADKDAAAILEAPAGARPRRRHPQLVTSGDAAEQLGALATEVFGKSRVTVEDNLPDALDRAIALAEEEGLGGGVIVTGSVIPAGEVRLLLGVTDTTAASAGWRGARLEGRPRGGGLRDTDVSRATV